MRIGRHPVVLAALVGGLAVGCPPAAVPRVPGRVTVDGPGGRAVDLSPLAVHRRTVFEPISDRRLPLLGFDARDVLDRVLGEVPADGLIVLDCADGYRAAVPAARFAPGAGLEPMFAFEIDGGEGPFEVRSSASGARVRLGPLYLVWSSTSAVSSSAFAYQVQRVSHRGGPAEPAAP